MNNPNTSRKTRKTSALVLSAALALFGCGAQSSSDGTDSTTSDSSDDTTKSSTDFLTQDTSVGVTLSTGDFELTSLQSSNSASDDGSGSVRQLTFHWQAAFTNSSDSVNYTLCQTDESASDNCQVLAAISDTLTYSLKIERLLDAAEFSYFVLAEQDGEQLSSSVKRIHPGELGRLAGYLKATKPGLSNYFGWQVAISGDGQTLAIGAYGEASNATGINANPEDYNSAANSSGALYIFRYDADTASWQQSDYLKADNAEKSDYFAYSIALNEDGTLVAVGAYGEDASTADDPSNNELARSGAVYLFQYNGSTWTQAHYLKAETPTENARFGYAVSLNKAGDRLAIGMPYLASDSTSQAGAIALFDYDSDTDQWQPSAQLTANNAGASDRFGTALQLSGEGTRLVAGVPYEDGDQDATTDSGAVYVFTYTDSGWAQEAYLTASNAGAGDQFGVSVALNDDGTLLATGANHEDSAATGINGDETNNSATASGAVYVFNRQDAAWTQTAYLKSTNSDGSQTANIPSDAFDASSTYWGDHFGTSVTLSADGTVLAVGASDEDSATIGINWDASDNNALNAGAVYLFTLSDGNWSQTAYIKAPTTQASDYFGASIDMVMNDDTQVLVTGAHLEDSGSSAINSDNSTLDDDDENDLTAAGAAYVY